MGRIVRGLVVAVVAVSVSSCIGATDRADFDREVRARGGGVTTEWIADAFGAVAVSVGGTSIEQLEVISARVNATSRTASVTARRIDRPDFVDIVVVAQGEVVSTTPVQNADDLPLDDIAIPSADLPLDQIEALADRALAEFGESDGFVDAIVIATELDARVVRLKLQSARRTADVVFTLDGSFVEIER